jgi:hypothetical protein
MQTATVRGHGSLLASHVHAGDAASSMSAKATPFTHPSACASMESVGPPSTATSDRRRHRRRRSPRLGRGGDDEAEVTTPRLVCPWEHVP